MTLAMPSRNFSCATLKCTSDILSPIVWGDGRDSNPRIPESQSGALSNYATDTFKSPTRRFLNVDDSVYNINLVHPVGNDPTSQALQASANPSQLKVLYYINEYQYLE